MAQVGDRGCRSGLSCQPGSAHLAAVRGYGMEGLGFIVVLLQGLCYRLFSFRVLNATVIYCNSTLQFPGGVLSSPLLMRSSESGCIIPVNPAYLQQGLCNRPFVGRNSERSPILLLNPIFLHQGLRSHTLSFRILNTAIFRVAQPYSSGRRALSSSLPRTSEHSCILRQLNPAFLTQGLCSNPISSET